VQSRTRKQQIFHNLLHEMPCCYSGLLKLGGGGGFLSNRIPFLPTRTNLIPGKIKEKMFPFIRSKEEDRLKWGF
jgi:hypothetical protein